MYGIYANIGVIYGVNVGVHIPAPWFASGNINVIYILSEYLEILRGRKTTWKTTQFSHVIDHTGIQNP